MFRLAMIILLAVISPSLAFSADRLDEFRNAKAKLFIPDDPYIVQPFVDDLHYEMLTGLMANSKWIILLSGKSDDEINEACAKRPFVFRKISEDSFSREHNETRGEIKDIFIRSRGVEYNVRQDYE